MSHFGQRIRFVVGLLLAAALGMSTATAEAKAPTDPVEARAFWSLQPPRDTPAPQVRNATWPASDTDRYLLARIEAAGLAPVGDADPTTLLRRVHFDLTGLPPTPDEIARFRGDPSPKAYVAVVDGLLASPRFGERWGRHWLDVARYGESTGKERNFAFPEAWRYRNWVFDALNADQPYDAFLREQIAGDLLPDADIPTHNRQTIATGFLAIGPKSLNERRREQFLMDVVDEQIDVTTRAILGMNIACARCHDHKSDPVTQSDYYALAGIFRSTDTLYGTETNRGNRQPSGYVTLAAEGTRATGVPGGSGGASPYRTDGSRTMGVQDGHPMQCALLQHGEINQRGPLVPRGFVAVLHSTDPQPIPANISGRRELADWLTSPSNPLTARVEVNRVWLHLFGRGLVTTPDNFGRSGERPSHPELLDHLAVEFLQDGWSVKRLVRRLVLTHAYRLDSTAGAAAQATDPDNVLRSHANLRRLDAEAIRDAMLSVAEQLELDRPVGSPVSRWGDGPVRRGMGDRLDPIVWHRSVYLPVIRGHVPEGLEVFDFAEPSLLVAERDATNVPAQALYLMNSPFVDGAARGLARRLAGAPDRTARIREAWLLTLGREPTATEERRAVVYLSSGDGPLRAWTTLSQSLLVCAEFRYLR